MLYSDTESLPKNLTKNNLIYSVKKGGEYKGDNYTSFFIYSVQENTVTWIRDTSIFGRFILTHQPLYVVSQTESVYCETIENNNPDEIFSTFEEAKNFVDNQ